jgi:hypothetical protein
MAPALEPRAVAVAPGFDIDEEPMKAAGTIVNPLDRGAPKRAMAKLDDITLMVASEVGGVHGASERLTCAALFQSQQTNVPFSLSIA